MPERGCFVCNSDEVPKGKFVVGEIDADESRGDTVEPDQIVTRFEGTQPMKNGGANADTLIGIGVARQIIEEGKTALVIVNPKQKIRMPGE